MSSVVCEIQCVAPFMVSTNMTRHKPVNCLVKSAPGFVYDALNTVGYSTFTSGCLSHTLQVQLLCELKFRNTDFIWFVCVF